MKKDQLLKLIAIEAERDRKNRQDLRYLQTMGFLVAKGFLRTNLSIPKLPNKRVNLADAIWAGKNVEPRILEVLPAAVLRLPRHFSLDREKFPELFLAVEALRKKQEEGPSVWGIPYDKYKIWVNLTLLDKRTKEATEKRVTKTFRFSPAAINTLKGQARLLQCTETEVIERLLVTIGSNP